MRIIKTDSYEKMSAVAASIIGAQIVIKPSSVLGLATGSSPIGTYQDLIKGYNDGVYDFSHIKTINLDEYVGISGENENSYRYFMNDNLFNHVNIDKANTFVPDGMAADKAAECERYENLAGSLGYADLQLLGIGQNGHIGFNEPLDYFPLKVHEVGLTESTIQANSRLFDDESQVPRTAITMGIGTIMQAKRILLIAGADKKDIIKEALYGKITPQVPASVLQLHRNTTVVVVDE